jgi:Ca-activated chloride channel family protein
MRFAHPFALWLLLMLPGLFLLLRLRQGRQTAFLCRFGDLALLRQNPARFPQLRRERVTATLLVLPVVSTILALGDPRFPYGTPQPRAGALDVVMVLDVSKSMAAEDYGQRSRLEQARAAARGLLPVLQGNRVGLVTFAGASFRQAELTEDLKALDFILQHWVTVDAIRVGGSDIAQAIDTGLALFPDAPVREKLMLLFSDGGDATGTLDVVLRKATQRGVRIVTLGLGRLEASRIPLYDAHHTFVAYMETEGQVVTTQLNEALLRQIAAATGGTYLRLARGTEWRHLLTQPAVVGQALKRNERKLFQLFLGIGLLAFGAHMLITRL